VTDGGVEFYNLCIDVAGLATVADSFGAIAARVVDEERLSWRELASLLKDDYHDAEPLRLLMKSAPQFGNGGTVADEFAVRITDAFVRFAKAKPTPAGFNIIPGVFSWAATIGMGKPVGATPNGRLDGAPISHGPNPDPGYPAPHTPTDMARSVSTAQCGYGNTSPLQLDMDPGLGRSDEAREKVSALIRTHFDMGGTMINLNVLNREQVLAAHEDPSLFPDLVVRVTGFSAYFASLSKEFRQLVVDRIIA
jgi:formate C-acetyltransferase